MWVEYHRSTTRTTHTQDSTRNNNNRRPTTKFLNKEKRLGCWAAVRQCRFQPNFLKAFNNLVGFGRRSDGSFARVHARLFFGQRHETYYGVAVLIYQCCCCCWLYGVLLLLLLLVWFFRARATRPWYLGRTFVFFFYSGNFLLERCCILLRRRILTDVIISLVIFQSTGKHFLFLYCSNYDFFLFLYMFFSMIPGIIYYPNHLDITQHNVAIVRTITTTSTQSPSRNKVFNILTRT